MQVYDDKISGLDKIKNSGETTITIDASDYPPFAIKTRGGYVGFDKILTAIENGDYDFGAATFTITPKRNMDVMFFQPYIVTGQAVVLDKKYKDSIFSYKDLNSTQFKIAFAKGNSSEASLKKFMPESRFYEVESADDLVGTIVKGKADAFIADMPCC
ncbi:MAG: transporter substrate-binding domain-containing protein [Desulfobacteraceae bacterium]|nr:transporter substrate-binding domain-containing protein [Desulfobacteraceae bacterium]